MLSDAAEEEQAGPGLEGPESELQKAKQRMTAFGVNPTRKPKQASAIAKEVKESDRYRPRYTVLSKVIPPTSLWITARASPVSLDELAPLIINEAQADMVAIFYAVEQHIATHGIGGQA
jgi:hypothetical protein